MCVYVCVRVCVLVHNTLPHQQQCEAALLRQRGGTLSTDVSVFECFEVREPGSDRARRKERKSWWSGGKKKQKTEGNIYSDESA